MKPVVNGLAETYQGQVDLLSLNAGSGMGSEAFTHYAMPGHPSYLLLAPNGEVLWRAFGPLDRGTIDEAIKTHLPTQ